MVETNEKKVFYLTPVKYNRVRSYISNLEQNIKITSKADLKIIEETKGLVDNIIKKLKIYYKLNTFFYTAIYFSFISYIFSDIAIISDLAMLFSRVIGILGTTIFFIAVFFSNRIIELYYQDLNLITAHLISIYSKYQKENIDELSETTGNYYKSFIEFFKSRGF